MRTATTYETEEEHRQRFAGPIRDASGFLWGVAGFYRDSYGVREKGVGFRILRSRFSIEV